MTATSTSCALPNDGVMPGGRGSHGATADLERGLNVALMPDRRPSAYSGPL